LQHLAENGWQESSSLSVDLCLCITYKTHAYIFKKKFAAKLRIFPHSTPQFPTFFQN
jgi:hypothetical protein